jgi:predicted nucleotidyltransferase
MLKETGIECLDQAQILKKVRKEVGLRLSQKYNAKRTVSELLNNAIRKLGKPFLFFSGLKGVGLSAKVPGLDLGKDENGRDVACCLQYYVALLRKRKVKIHTLIVLGSRAKGRARSKSDVDVTLIASDLPGKSIPEFTNFPQKIMNIRRQMLLSDFPLLIGVQQSSCCSEAEFMQWLEEFRVIALDAIYYGKIIYDDGFWKRVKLIFAEMDNKYSLSDTEIPELLFSL